jgi:ribonuclease Z
VVLDRHGVRVTAFSVDHQPVVPAVGYRIDYSGHGVVITGDTRRSEKVVRAAQGADLLIHEALFGEELLARLKEYFRRRGLDAQVERMDRLREYHSSSVDAAEVAAEAGVRTLVLTHVMALKNPIARSLYLRGVTGVFRGRVVVGEDGVRFDL